MIKRIFIVLGILIVVTLLIFLLVLAARFSVSAGLIRVISWGIVLVILLTFAADVIRYIRTGKL
jgi:hypothetical protein